MVSTFFGLETARRALQTQQLGLDVTGHNISNANTAGYTRQIANLQATSPLTINNSGNQMQVGTGVTTESITRVRDAYVDRQYRYESSKQQYWQTKQNSLQQIESILNEPTENSLRTELDQFWNAWSDLSNDSESLAARTVVKERAASLVNSFHNIAEQVTQMQQNLDNTVRLQIKQINTYANQLADLNQKIAQLEAAGGSPNDLYDERDKVIDDLSKIVNVQVIEKNSSNSTNKEITVVIGDSAAIPQQVLVSGGKANLLKEYSIPAKEGEGLAAITWDNEANAGNTDQWGNTVKLGNSGSLISAIEIRGDLNGENGYIAGFMSEIDALANGVATAVNSLHQLGQDFNGDDGLEFFQSDSTLPITAANIKLNEEIANDVSKIAAAEYDAGGVNAGDGTIAQKISSLSEGWTALTGLGIDAPLTSSSFASFYSASVSKIGADVQSAESMQELQSALVTQVTNQREAVSGVSLDEEMINLMKFQKSYNAAARIVTMMDSLLDTIINGMGVTR